MADTTDPPHLLTIPRELRNNIYARLGVTTQLANHQYLGEDCMTVFVHHLHNTNVLHTCKQLEAEMLETEHAESIVVFEVDASEWQDNLPFTTRLRPKCIKLLQIASRARECIIVVGLKRLTRVTEHLSGGPQVPVGSSDEYYTTAAFEKLRSIAQRAADIATSATRIDLVLEMGRFPCGSSLGGRYDFHIGKQGSWKLRPEVLAALQAEQPLSAAKLEISVRFTIDRFLCYSIPAQNSANTRAIVDISDDEDSVPTLLDTLGVKELEWRIKPVLSGQQADVGFPGLRLEFVREYVSDRPRVNGWDIP